MENSTSYVASSGISSGSLTLAIPGGGTRPPTESSKDLIATTAVRAQAGWLGQVLVDRAIVFQTEPQESQADAMRGANGRVVDVLTRLFRNAE